MEKNIITMYSKLLDEDFDNYEDGELIDLPEEYKE